MKNLVFVGLLMMSAVANAFDVKIENKTESAMVANLVVFDTNQNPLSVWGDIAVPSTKVYNASFGEAPASDRFLVRWSVTGENGQPLCLEGQFPVMGNETLVIVVDGHQGHGMVGCSIGRH